MTGGLLDLVARAGATGLTIHSLQVSVAERIVVSAETAPFGIDVPHRFYSVAKSFTGLAVLLLAERGMLRLDDPITPHFPEFPGAHPWVVSTRIDDMLAMTGPHPRTTFQGEDWLGSYFRVTPTQPPATLFTYDTSASYVLSALVERLSRSPLIDVLREGLLDPLGVGATARFLTGPEGVSHGGSGLLAAPADMLAVAETINGHGMRGGRRILSERVVEALLRRRSDTGMLGWNATFRRGYGRHIWLPGGDTWMMFGLGGQIVYGDPARRLAAVVTADASPLPGGDQRLAEALVDALATDPIDVPREIALTAPTPPHRSDHTAPIDGVWRLRGGDGAPDRIVITADAHGGRLTWTGGPDLEFDTGRARTVTTPAGPAMVTAGWPAPGILDVRMSAAAEDIATLRVRIARSGTGGEIAVQSQGSGPGADDTWTWRGAFHREDDAARLLSP